MKKKILWLVVSCLMVLSLVMAACAPAAVEEEEEKAPVTEEKAPEQKVEEEVVAPAVEKPKYGGVLKVGYPKEITKFDEVVGGGGSNDITMLTNESLWGGDWTKGPAGGYGTNETDWTNKTDIWENNTGYIAESWEIPNKIEGELATLVWHIRKGVHWALSPESKARRLVGGRELTADDVVFSLKQVITDPRADLYKTSPDLRIAKITSPAPWTVKIEVPWESFEAAISRLADYVTIVPPEVVQQLGDMNDWKLNCGTGPFMLTDFVPGSTATLVRNPNYWNKDPIGPGKGNQLPYVDGVKYLIIRDRSTMLSAIRTAKIDHIRCDYWSNATLEEVTSLKKTTPQLMSMRATGLVNAQGQVAVKLSSPPFNDIRVRRALMMAIDWEGIKNDYFGGGARYVNFPITYSKEFAAAYYGPDEQGQWPSDCPESVKELYSYNPEKARELLAEAGYPQGFKTNMILTSEPADIDYFSIIADMWAKVGIDLELRPKEAGSYETIKIKKSWDQMFEGLSCNIANIYKQSYYYGESPQNMSGVNDPVVNESHPKIQRAIVTGRAEANRLHRELMKYMLDQVWVIPRVIPLTYNLWWPWIKNYRGELFLGFTHKHFYDHIWLDQELKKSMGY